MRQAFVTRDQFIALMLLPFVFALIALLYIPVILCQGRPFLYRSERMRDANNCFQLLKIRTMHRCPVSGDLPLGGYNADRVTGIGRFLRRTRLDELPQIFNVLRGDIVFVGPRPPLPCHVAACPARYRKLLSICRPGITGLATVTLHRREERLLARCDTVAETEDVYLRRCLPIKLRLDLIYAKNRSLPLDAAIAWRTVVGLRLRDAPLSAGNTGKVTSPQADTPIPELRAA